jgi:hypothetical protein
MNSHQYALVYICQWTHFSVPLLRYANGLTLVCPCLDTPMTHISMPFIYANELTSVCPCLDTPMNSHQYVLVYIRQCIHFSMPLLRYAKEQTFIFLNA